MRVIIVFQNDKAISTRSSYRREAGLGIVQKSALEGGMKNAPCSSISTVSPLF